MAGAVRCLRCRTAGGGRRLGAVFGDATLQRQAFRVQRAQALQLVGGGRREPRGPVSIRAVQAPVVVQRRSRLRGTAVQPGGGCIQRLPQRRRHAGGQAAQRLQHAFQRRQQRHQHGHALAQRARMAQCAAAFGVVAELGDQLIQCQDVAGKPMAAIIGARAAAQDRRGPAAGVGKPGRRALAQRGRHLGREHDRSDQPGTDDADHDFLDARHGNVEDLRRLADRRQRHDRQCVCGQQEHIAARRALQQRQVHQHGDPQRDCTHQHDRHVDQLRHGRHRGGGAEHRAGHAVGRLGTGGAGQGMGNEVHRRHGPVRPRQAKRQRDIERQHRGGECLQREQPLSCIRPASHGAGS
ncbi:hypothetical protein D3C81_834040 [compost metagenome]